MIISELYKRDVVIRCAFNRLVFYRADLNMALIFSAQRARFGFTLSDKQPKAGKTFWISSVIWTNTALSELRSPVLGSGEIWLQVVQTAWSWEELGFRFPWSWLVPAAGESGSSGCLAVLAPGCVTPRDVHLCLSDCTSRWPNPQLSLPTFTTHLM